MHQQAREFVALNRHTRDVCEFGSYYVNGAVRDLFPDCNYVGVDIRPGPGVDIVGDCATWDDGRRFDIVLCCEVFEHAENWKKIVGNAYKLLRGGGRFIVTAAGPNRPKHTCDGQAWSDKVKEHYKNIEPDKLKTALEVAGFKEVYVKSTGQDVYAVARK